MIVAATVLFPNQNKRVMALPPDERARFDEIAGSLQFEMGQDRIHAERNAYAMMFGDTRDDYFGYHYPDFNVKPVAAIMPRL